MSSHRRHLTPRSMWVDLMKVSNILEQSDALPARVTSHPICGMIAALQAWRQALHAEARRIGMAGARALQTRRAGARPDEQ